MLEQSACNTLDSVDPEALTMSEEDEAWLRMMARAPDRGGPAATAAATGQVLAGRYEIQGEAGRGGMGVVYRALDRQGGGTVAVKVVTADGHIVERFLREARLLSELQHPGIVRYLQHGQTAEGRPILVMEWLEGEDLGRRLRREGSLPIASATALLRRVADALSFAHSRGVIHRDIKPHNLFLRHGDPGDAVVLDLGMAREDGGVAMTRTGMALGTPAYMAPEQIDNASGVGPAADIFSLGCVMFECVAGRRPFVHKFADQVVLQIMTTDAPRVRSFCPYVPEALDGLIDRMLKRNLAERIADGAALLRALEGVK